MWILLFLIPWIDHFYNDFEYALIDYPIFENRLISNLIQNYHIENSSHHHVLLIEEDYLYYPIMLSLAILFLPNQRDHKLALGYVLHHDDDYPNHH